MAFKGINYVQHRPNAMIHTYSDSWHNWLGYFTNPSKKGGRQIIQAVGNEFAADVGRMVNALNHPYMDGKEKVVRLCFCDMWTFDYKYNLANFKEMCSRIESMATALGNNDIAILLTITSFCNCILLPDAKFPAGKNLSVPADFVSHVYGMIDAIPQSLRVHSAIKYWDIGNEIDHLLGEHGGYDMYGLATAYKAIALYLRSWLNDSSKKIVMNNAGWYLNDLSHQRTTVAYTDFNPVPTYFTPSSGWYYWDGAYWCANNNGGQLALNQNLTPVDNAKINYSIHFVMATNSYVSEAWQIGRMLFNYVDANNYYVTTFRKDNVLEVGKSINGVYSKLIEKNVSNPKFFDWLQWDIYVSDRSAYRSIQIRISNPTSGKDFAMSIYDDLDIALCSSKIVFDCPPNCNCYLGVKYFIQNYGSDAITHWVWNEIDINSLHAYPFFEAYYNSPEVWGSHIEHYFNVVPDKQLIIGEYGSDASNWDYGGKDWKSPDNESAQDNAIKAYQGIFHEKMLKYPNLIGAMVFGQNGTPLFDDSGNYIGVGNYGLYSCWDYTKRNKFYDSFYNWIP